MVSKEQIVRWLENTATVLNANKEYLTELDSAIGDADHGINMDRGFKKGDGKAVTVADKDIGNILKTIGMTLISSVGGAVARCGTFFMRSGMTVIAKEELTNDDLYKLLLAGVEEFCSAAGHNWGQNHVRCLGGPWTPCEKPVLTMATTRLPSCGPRSPPKQG